MIIYLIVDKTNGKQYIGQTRRTIKERLEAHRYGKGYLGAAIRKHGISNFTIEEIDYALSQDDLDSLERLYIKKYNSMAPNGYNLTDGGTGNYNVANVVKVEMKDKASTLERKQKMSDTAMRTWEARRRNELAKEQLLAACNCMDCKHWRNGEGDKYCLGCYKYTQSYSPTGEEDVMEFEVVPDTILESIPEIWTDKSMPEKIRRLPVKNSAAIMLKYYGKMNRKEIAEAMSISDRTVDRLLKEAMAMLNS